MFRKLSFVLLFLFATTCSAAETYKTKMNPFTGKLDYVHNTFDIITGTTVVATTFVSSPTVYFNNAYSTSGGSPNFPAGVSVSGTITGTVAGSVTGASGTFSNVEFNTLNTSQYVWVGNTHTTIQAAIDSITDESASKIYTVMVPSGVYDEKVVMAPYINLSGVDRDGVIIAPSSVIAGDICITGASNAAIANLSIKCTTYVGDPGAPTGSYQGVQFTSCTNAHLLDTFIDIVNNTNNFAVNILGGSPTIDGVETDGLLCTQQDGGAIDPTPVVTNCHFGNTNLLALNDASIISQNIFDRITTSTTLANYATIDNCGIYGISYIGGNVVFDNCVFWEDSTGNVAVDVQSSPTKSIFRNCTFRALDTYAVSTDTGFSRYENCTFMGGTNSPALYVYHHSDGTELYNCTLLKHGAAVVAIDADAAADGETVIHNCWMNSGIDADLDQTVGNTYQINSDLTIGDIQLNGGDLTGPIAASLDMQAGTPTADPSNGNDINITASAAVATGDATSGNGGSIVINAGAGASVGAPGPANTGGSFTVNIGTAVSVPGATNGIARITLNDPLSSTTVADILALRRTYAGGAGGANIGTGLIFESEDASSNVDEAGNIDVLFPTATHSGQTARMNLGTLGTNVISIGTFGTNLWTVPIPPAAGAGNGITITASNAVTNGAGGAIGLTAGNAVASGGNGNTGGAITLTGGTGAATGPSTAYGGDINLVGGTGANRKGSVLLDAGITVGSTTQPGDNNLRVEGTSALVGDVTCTGDIAINGGNITSTAALDIACAAASAVSIKTDFIVNPPASADQTHFYYGADDDIYLSYGSYTPGGAVYMRSINSGTTFTLTSAGNCTIAGTLTVNGSQVGATDHVFDEFDDLDLLEKWRAGEELPFATGDMLNRDRLLRDTIIQQAKVIEELKSRVEKLEKK